MKHFILITLLSCSMLANAKGTSSTTGFTNSQVTGELTPKEFAGRFQVSGDLFITSADGKRLLTRISESRTGRPAEDTTEVSSNWGHSTKYDGREIGLFIRYSFAIASDGTLKAHIQQFESMVSDRLNGNVKTGKIIREQTTDVVDFAPINWVAYQDSKIRVVARITPLLLDRGNSFSPDNMPIALDQAVLVDRTGKLWGDDLSEGGGKFVALATHKGTLAISYYPFQGAKEIGIAKGNEILLNNLSPAMTLRNTKPFLTANGEMKVYGMVIPNRKTSHLNSVNMIVSDREQEFVGSLK